ncbi:MAG: hypothetical protein PVI21_03880 [Candidatus Woesebacteria bacterium]|jgi:hypothetical protein
MIIGIAGAIGSGKSTVAEILAQLEPKHAIYESGLIISELANDFNKILQNELNDDTDQDIINQTLIQFVDTINSQLDVKVTWNQLAITPERLIANPKNYDKIFKYLKLIKHDPQILTQKITPQNKPTYRMLLQWIGGYLIAMTKPTIWTDEILRRISRFDDDKNLIIICGIRYPKDAEIIKQSGGIILKVERPGIESDTTDITEEQQGDIKPSTTLVNNGSMNDLQAVLEKVWFDASVNKTKNRYQALAQ